MTVVWSVICILIIWRIGWEKWYTNKWVIVGFSLLILSSAYHCYTKYGNKKVSRIVKGKGVGGGDSCPAKEFLNRPINPDFWCNGNTYDKSKALLSHPDKNPGCVDDAKQLFQMVANTCKSRSNKSMQQSDLLESDKHDHLSLQSTKSKLFRVPDLTTKYFKAFKPFRVRKESPLHFDQNETRDERTLQIVSDPESKSMKKMYISSPHMENQSIDIPRLFPKSNISEDKSENKIEPTPISKTKSEYGIHGIHGPYGLSGLDNEPEVESYWDDKGQHWTYSKGHGWTVTVVDDEPSFNDNPKYSAVLPENYDSDDEKKHSQASRSSSFSSTDDHEDALYSSDPSNEQDQSDYEQDTKHEDGILYSRYSPRTGDDLLTINIGSSPFHYGRLPKNIETQPQESNSLEADDFIDSIIGVGSGIGGVASLIGVGLIETGAFALSGLGYIFNKLASGIENIAEEFLQ